MGNLLKDPTLLNFWVIKYYSIYRTSEKQFCKTDKFNLAKFSVCTNPIFTKHLNTLWLKEIGFSDSLWSMKLIWVWINTEYNTVEGVSSEEFSVWINTLSFTSQTSIHWKKKKAKKNNLIFFPSEFLYLRLRQRQREHNNLVWQDIF